MARFQHLPLFQKCYNFSKEVYQLKLKLPQNLKHDLGSDLFKSALKSTKLIILANGSENKERALKELFLEVQVIWVWLRLLVDLKAIKEINQKGMTILLVEQNAYLALKISNRAYVLTNGEISLQGKASELLNNAEIKKAYLGH